MIEDYDRDAVITFAIAIGSTADEEPIGKGG